MSAALDTMSTNPTAISMSGNTGGANPNATIMNGGAANNSQSGVSSSGTQPSPAAQGDCVLCQMWDTLPTYGKIGVGAGVGILLYSLLAK